MMRADIRTTVSPIVGTERQSEELVMYLLEGFEEDPAKIWSSNIFGKSLHELVGEGLHDELSKMPMDARLKLPETLSASSTRDAAGSSALSFKLQQIQNRTHAFSQYVRFCYDMRSCQIKYYWIPFLRIIFCT